MIPPAAMIHLGDNEDDVVRPLCFEVIPPPDMRKAYQGISNKSSVRRGNSCDWILLLLPANQPIAHRRQFVYPVLPWSSDNNDTYGKNHGPRVGQEIGAARR